MSNYYTWAQGTSVSLGTQCSSKSLLLRYGEIPHQHALLSAVVLESTAEVPHQQVAKQANLSFFSQASTIMTEALTYTKKPHFL